MRSFFGYIRVSTARQGEKGVSLAEQRDAIARHAERNALDIVEWFEERQTAAKRGRPVFTRMLRLLRQGTAEGVVIHKIDRGARNLKDWADLGELIDGGVEVHFANESLDLHSRGGRLSADIQAVVAADYIRNLREETLKGVRGRLKQGLYPLPAPLGYLDGGKGKPKEPDPAAGPLVRRAFELYGTGNWGLDSLLVELHRLGLRNKRNGRVTRNGLSTILNNPFYIGLIRIKRTGEIFEGVHEPLIRKSLFDRVQDILRGKTPRRTTVHDFLYRRLFTCAGCGYSLIGERQKGHVYYRCQTKGCPTKTVREERLTGAILKALDRLRLDPGDLAYLRGRLAERGANWEAEHAERLKHLRLNLNRIKDRLMRLTDAYIDGAIEREMLEERKGALLMERKGIQETLATLERSDSAPVQRVLRFLELAADPCSSYELASTETKRGFLRQATSNRQVDGGNVALMLSEPLSLVSSDREKSHGAPYRAKPRTLDKLVDRLFDWFKSHPSGLDQAFSTVTGHHSRDHHGDKAPLCAA